jgi:hypothetical protein
MAAVCWSPADGSGTLEPPAIITEGRQPVNDLTARQGLIERRVPCHPLQQNCLSIALRDVRSRRRRRRGGHGAQGLGILC